MDNDRQQWTDEPEELPKQDEPEEKNEPVCADEKSLKEMVISDNKKHGGFDEFLDDDIALTRNEVRKFIEQRNLEDQRRSEEAYIEIVQRVVEMSGDNLTNLRKNKQWLRIHFLKLFRLVLYAQIFVLFILLFLMGFIEGFDIADSIILTYMTTVFVETLGVITLMVMFAFKSDEEINIIQILNAVVENFQKFDRRKNDTKEEDEKKK